MEREIVEPIEEAFSSISGVDWRAQASSTDGLAQFIVFFDFEKDIQEASQDIRDAISTKRADLPTEMEEPVLTRFDPSQQSVVSLALTSSTVPTAVLTRIADPMIVARPAHRAGRGAGDGGRRGGARAHGPAPAGRPAGGRRDRGRRWCRRCEAQNLAAPVGRLNGALDERAIRLKGRLDDAGGLRAAGRGGAERPGRSVWARWPTRLDGTEEQRTLALFNGREAVGIEILKAKGYSTTEVSRRDPQARRARCSDAAARASKLELVQDAGDRVQPRGAQRAEALIEGALLTVLVVFLFLNSWRSTVITGLALPVSVLAVVHRGLGLRLHAQHHVAARACRSPSAS